MQSRVEMIFNRADELCSFGSSNYRYQRPIASSYHKLFAFAEAPDADPLTFMALVAKNHAAIMRMNTPYDLDDFFSNIQHNDALKYLAKSYPRAEIAGMEVFIAESYMCQHAENQWRTRTYVDTLKDIDRTGVPDLFYEDIYLNGMYSSIYGFGNCELRADALFIELIREGSFDDLHLLRLKPCDRHGLPLEQLFFIAVGDWPNPGCQIMVPWFQRNRLFEWKGTLEATLSDFKSGLDEPTIDPKTSFIERILSTNKLTIGPMRRMVDATYERLLSDKPVKFLAIRALYSLFLKNALDHEPSPAFSEGSRGPYRYGLQFQFFSGLGEDSGLPESSARHWEPKPN